MIYYFSKVLDIPFEDAITGVSEELRREGFVIVTAIDMKDAFKRKLDFDIQRYQILGTYNPLLTYLAVRMEDKIGTMLPGNIIIQELADARVEVAAVDPVASTLAVGNQDLDRVISQVKAKLQKVIANL